MKKILCIDGGGIKGVFPASFLATIEDTINEKVADYFDLIVGTSTGGIIALGLGLGLSAKEILALYEEFGISVFAKKSLLHKVSALFKSKYDKKPLQRALEKKFGDRLLGESTKRLVIPSFSYENGEVHVFKTSHHPRFQRDYKEKVVNIALATSAAPTYFPSHTTTSGLPLIDGGIWANNPIGLSAVEAIGVLGWPKDQIKILSLGCTTSPVNYRSRFSTRGVGYWALKFVDLFMAAQSSSSTGTGILLVGEENISRVNVSVAKDRFSLDGVGDINVLKGMGDAEARKMYPKLKKIFFTDKAEAFTPFHKLK